jgi:hypothetical protein
VFDIPLGFAYSPLEFDRSAACLAVSFDRGDLGRSVPIPRRLRDPFRAVTQCLILTSTQLNRFDATPRMDKNEIIETLRANRALLEQFHVRSLSVY